MSEPVRPEARGQEWPYVAQRRAPEGLGIASAVIAIVLTFVELGTAVAAVPAETAFREALQDGREPSDVITLYDGLELLLFLVMIAAYIVSCLWLQAARTNAAVIAPRDPHARSKIWVWLGWWVPVVSLWFPYQVVRDVREASRPSGPSVGLGLWWTAWIVYAIGGRVTDRLSTSSDVDTVDLLSVFEVVTAVAVVVGCVQWCRVVHRITTDQQAALSAPPTDRV